ncbi:hypothetical protein FIS27_17870 [Salmonella enterica subsp. enterica]|nr:hypothetical protein [Salmonella enterica subsp. enterica serovar Newport]
MNKPMIIQLRELSWQGLLSKIYDFVKFNRPEGEGLDGRDGPERQSLAKVVDAVEDLLYRNVRNKK